MTDAAPRRMEPEAFLAWMMAGATQAHDQIVINLIAMLRPGLRGGPCRVQSSDQAARTARGLRRPCVTIDRGPRERTSFESTEPTVLFEVLSPSTRRIDLPRKVDEYQHMPTVRQFVILEPDRAWAIAWSRDGVEGGWSSETIEGVDGVLGLPSVGAELPMVEIYEDVELAP